MRFVTIALIASIAGFIPTASIAQQNESGAWHQVAEAIPLGSKIKVQTLDGRRVTGTLMRVDGNELMVKRNTRRPEPALTIAFSSVSKIERDYGKGTNVGKAIAIGFASGAGIIVGLILFAMTLD